MSTYPKKLKIMIQITNDVIIFNKKIPAAPDIGDS
jgi:hypothetical protein